MLTDVLIVLILALETGNLLALWWWKRKRSRKRTKAIPRGTKVPIPAPGEPLPLEATPEVKAAQKDPDKPVEAPRRNAREKKAPEGGE